MLIEDINWHFKTSGRETHKSISYPRLKQITEAKAKNNNNNNNNQKALHSWEDAEGWLQFLVGWKQHTKQPFLGLIWLFKGN